MENVLIQDHRGTPLNLYVFQTKDLHCQGLVYLVHGMKDHSARYFSFAEFLSQQGYVVMMHDQRGHGKTAVTLGYLGENATWDNLVQNVHDGITYAKHRFSHLPVFLLGHSMGSFVALDYAKQFQGLSGLLLSGSAFQSPFLTFIGYAVSLFNQALFGRHNKAYLIDFLVFFPFIVSVKNRRTPFDWLSRDATISEHYRQDFYCQFTCTSSFYVQFFSGLFRLFNSKKPFLKQKLPILLLSGDQDPVGGHLKYVKKLFNWLSQESHDISTCFYEGARHEVLNETNKNQVYQDILLWLQDQNKP